MKCTIRGTGAVSVDHTVDGVKCTPGDVAGVLCGAVALCDVADDTGNSSVNKVGSCTTAAVFEVACTFNGWIFMQLYSN